MSDVALKHLQGRIYAALNSRVSLSANAAANEALLKLCARLSAVEAERDAALGGECPYCKRMLAAEARVEALSEALLAMWQRFVLERPVENAVELAQAALAALPERQEQP